MGTLFTILIVFLIVALILYLFNKLMPVEQGFKSAVNAIVVVLFVIWLLYRLWGAGDIRL